MTNPYLDLTLAQAAGGADLITTFVPLILIFIVFYIFLIRPQQRKMKAHQEMINNVRRGDRVVTSGGLIGKVVKAIDDNDEIEVEIAKDVRVKIARGMLSDVKSKGEVSAEKAS